MKIDGVELSEEQVEEFKEAFAEFDQNSDETITTDELGFNSSPAQGEVRWPWDCAGLVIRRLEGEFPTEEELKQMVAEVDQVRGTDRWPTGGLCSLFKMSLLSCPHPAQALNFQLIHCQLYSWFKVINIYFSMKGWKWDNRVGWVSLNDGVQSAGQQEDKAREFI